MGETTAEKPWLRAVEEVLKRVSEKLGPLEAVIVFGSWSRGGGGVWSDIDILIVTDNAEKLGILERFGIASEIGVHGIDLFIYSYREIESMARKGNPLALSALIEGIRITTSERIERLAKEISNRYERIGRMWKSKY